MRLAYVDTSCVVAAAFAEPSARTVREAVSAYDELVSSNLLEAELRSSAARESVTLEEAWLEPFSWVLPLRPLSGELSRALAGGYLRGADLWHVACALYVAGDVAALDFLTLDARQREIAAAAGLNAPIL